MTIIIWWCCLMAILPLFYFFLLRNSWRLFLGFIILLITLFGYFAPEAIAYSIMKTEIEKSKPSFQQLQTNLDSITDIKPNDSDSERVRLEKNIIWKQKLFEQIKEMLIEGSGDKKKNLLDYQKEYCDLIELIGEWREKWGERTNFRVLLFCGKEFNQELMRKEIGSNEVEKKEVEDFNIIDFEKNTKIDDVQKFLQKTCQLSTRGSFPTIWLKNIDKITDSEVKNRVLEMIDFKKNANLGKIKQQIKSKEGKVIEEIDIDIDLSRFILVATTLTKNPKSPSELLNKLKKIESFWDKHFWWIFSFSLGLEVLIFYLIFKFNKKNSSQMLLNY
ncbi:MAG: hypothetical protein mread185_000480 [Mycoplasmataceae bacterium]|nr:MAG: hypothetical protein mread185_000480 [Mycoplasmataceae bacterium]